MHAPDHFSILADITLFPGVRVFLARYHLSDSIYILFNMVRMSNVLKNGVSLAHHENDPRYRKVADSLSPIFLQE